MIMKKQQNPNWWFQILSWTLTVSLWGVPLLLRHTLWANERRGTGHTSTSHWAPGCRGLSMEEGVWWRIIPVTCALLEERVEAAAHNLHFVRFCWIRHSGSGGDPPPSSLGLKDFLLSGDPHAGRLLVLSCVPHRGRWRPPGLQYVLPGRLRRLPVEGIPGVSDGLLKSCYQITYKPYCTTFGLLWQIWWFFSFVITFKMCGPHTFSALTNNICKCFWSLECHCFSVLFNKHVSMINYNWWGPIFSFSYC